MEKNKALMDKIESIPNEPGCYLWKNNQGIIVYIGKAKSLKKRVKQYFLKSHNFRIQKLISEIADIDYIIVNNEIESLLLEQNLIKKHLPKYNVVLKDDKRYPYVVITNEKHPKLIYRRQLSDIKNKKSVLKYYGPFPDGTSTRDIVNLLNIIFPLRKCNVLPKEECIYYHIKQCLAPCIKEIKQSDYDPIIKKINEFFTGNITEVKNILKDREIEAVKNLQFELANESKIYLNAIENFKDKQIVDINKKGTIEVLGYAERDSYLAIILFKYESGELINMFDFVTKVTVDTHSSILSFINQYYSMNKIPKSLVLPEELKSDEKIVVGDVEIIYPNKATFKHIVELANKNAEEILSKKMLTAKFKYDRTLGAVNELQNLLNIPSAYRIELFDNAHFAGEFPISGMVVYINGEKFPSEFRKYNLDNFKEGSDFDYMKEVIYRRYYRLLMEGAEMPNLIIVDGGKIQVGAAKGVLDSLNINIPIIGLKKNNKHKTESIVKWDNTEITLDKTSPLYLMLSKMQDDVHNFVIGSLHQKKSKGMVEGAFKRIPGIKPILMQKLYDNFETYQNIKEASLEELSDIIPKEIAERIVKYFRGNND